jgi:hypothetical protein
VARVDMRIPPMPSGPLSVRDFHLESAMSAEGPWRHASATFSTLDRPEMQSWAIRPPRDAILGDSAARCNPGRFGRPSKRLT